MSSFEPFNRLVRLAARAFYDDVTMKGDNQPKTGRGDNRGMAVVVLDALTRRQWVREEDLAKALKLHSKQLRRTLRFFEEEKLVTREHRKETAKGVKIDNAAVAATDDGQQLAKEGDEKNKIHTHSYCCLDYAQDEYVKAYYAALAKRQEEQEEASRRMQEEAEKYKASTSDLSNGIFEVPYDRQVGMKSKREDDENDDVDWEEAAPTGNAGETLDLNAQPEASGDDEDDIDWEEG